LAAPQRYPPGPRSGVLRLLQTYRDPLGSALDLRRRYGPIAHVRLGPRHIYIVNDPEAIREVLVGHHRSFRKGQALQNARRLLGDGLLTNQGEPHRRQRRILQPHFHHERIAGYARVMTSFAQRARDRWQPGQEVDVADEMMRLTLGITGKALFDVDLEEEPELLAALSAGVDDFNRIVLPAAALVDKLPLPSSRRARAMRARIDAHIARMIAERRQAPEKHPDMLTMLLLAQDTEGDGGGMSDRQVRDEAVTILLAGHETTANAMTWTWYLLSQHPEAEAKLQAEAREVLQGKPATVEDVPRLRYARMVMAEGMRLFPPAWIISRQALESVQIAGYRVP
jgi:cytochrome P450